MRREQEEGTRDKVGKNFVLMGEQEIKYWGTQLKMGSNPYTTQGVPSVGKKKHLEC